MKSFWQDIRFAFRLFSKSPAFVLVAVLTLAIGIGANTAIFSVADALLLRPLPYRDPDRVVLIWERNIVRDRPRNVIAAANFLDWREQSNSFEQMAAIVDGRFSVIGAGEPQEVSVQYVSPSLLPMLGASPVLGRGFLPEEEGPNSDRVVMLSHSYWQTRFGADPSVLGRALTLDGESFTIVGVLQPDFQFFGPFSDRAAELWTPMRFDPARDYRRTAGRFMLGAARLKAGVSLTQAQAEMDTLSHLLEVAYPDFNTGWDVVLVPLREQLAGNLRTALYVLLAAVGAVLLIACANVANLLLARAGSRQTEIAIRTSLGAGRSRVIRQMLTENLLLALIGGGLGFLLAIWGVEALAALGSQSLPQLVDIQVDLRVFAFTAAVSIATGLVFGLAPALLAVRRDVNSLLKEAGRSGVGSVRTRRASAAVVSAQIALSLVLLVGAGLLIRSFQQLLAVQPGFQPEHVLTARVNLPGSRYEGPQRTAFFQRAIQDLQAMPEVRSASAVDFLPFSGPAVGTGFLIEGRPTPAAGQTPVATVRTIFPGFFRTMGIPLLRGREFEERDTADTPRAYVVSEAMVREHFPNQDPLGQRIVVQLDTGVPGEIIGVASDIKDSTLDGEVRPTVYYVHPQSQRSFMTLVVRATGDPSGAGKALTGIIQSIDQKQPVSDIRVMDEVIARTNSRRRFQTWLLTASAALALGLATIGVYGVMSYSVAQRTHELGVRMAIGAQRGDVLWMVLRQGMAIAGAGLILGLAGAFVITRAMASLLYNVTPTDPLTFAFVALLLAATAALAMYVPARRATKVDPMVVLRYE